MIAGSEFVWGTNVKNTGKCFYGGFYPKADSNRLGGHHASKVTSSDPKDEGMQIGFLLNSCMPRFLKNSFRMQQCLKIQLKQTVN
jgi:hypothetical protein